jgi:hypothetical protein
MLATVETNRTQDQAQAVASTPLPAREANRRVGAASAPTRPLPPVDGLDVDNATDNDSPGATQWSPATPPEATAEEAQVANLCYQEAHAEQLRSQEDGRAMPGGNRHR